jgi:SulP family sulfate permease
MFRDLRAQVNLGKSLEPIPYYLTRPARVFKGYDRRNIRPDVVAGITVAVILLPQAIAFALIAELPPQMGIYTAAIAAIIAGLWGSSHQTHTGPTNAMSLLVLSILLSLEPESYVVAAGMLALMAGILQLGLGLARLGMLVHFVSHSVIVGFATGAGALIIIRQIPHLLGIDVSAEGIGEYFIEIFSLISEINPITAALGIGTIILIVVLRYINKRIPAALIAMILSSILVAAFTLTDRGVVVLQQLPQSLPPFSSLPILDLGFVSRLSTGALAIAAIGLVETTAISRSIASKTGQRLDSNQEFVGQGLANVVVGFFSGYPSAGSFSRSAVNFDSGAKTSVSALFSSLFLFVAVFAAAPMAQYLPRAALAGVLIVVAIGMVNKEEIARIWEGTRGDALIMLVTFLGTLLIDIAFAILLGIMLSFAVYLLRTSMPRVHQVVPDEEYRHFSYQPDRPLCPQLGVIDILGDLYFGAVSHVEEAIHTYEEREPDQRFLLIRMHNVNHCDFSGIHMLESVVNKYRDRGGDVFMVKVGYRVDRLMSSTGFDDSLGQDNFLTEDAAVSDIFYHTLDPAVCIYECPVRVFKECQNLPKQLYLDDIGVLDEESLNQSVEKVSPEELWSELKGNNKNLTVIDVREPREYNQGHIPEAQLVPLPQIISGNYQFDLGGEHEIVLVCRTGRRSRRAAHCFSGNEKVRLLRGGMLAWEAAGLLEAVN